MDRYTELPIVSKPGLPQDEVDLIAAQVWAEPPKPGTPKA
jgi:hypothetical protein